MSLQRYARGWWEQLSFLAPDVLADLGKLITQLERGLSSLDQDPHQGEPSGWSGLSRRGHWQRLVTSEWALLEDHPEEFLRRASQGELSFWELAQSGQSRGNTECLWLDVGPDQLGACRIVQMALLLMFWHRRKGSLVWGIIQQPDRLYDQLGGDEIRLYLQARSLDAPGRPPAVQANQLNWCIGSRAWVSQNFPGYRSLMLEQISLDRVEVRHRGHRIELRLPPPDRATRLLRDPFALKRPSPLATPGPQAGDLQFSADGTKLLVVDDQTIHLFPLPQSLADIAGKPRRFSLPRSGRVIAVGFEKRTLSAVQEHEDSWLFSVVNPGRVDQDHFRQHPRRLAAPQQLGTCRLSPLGWVLWLGDRSFEEHSEELLEAPLQGLVPPTRQPIQLGQFQRLEAFLQQLPRESWQCFFHCAFFGVSGLESSLALVLDERRVRLLWGNENNVVECESSKLLGLAPFAAKGMPVLVEQHTDHFLLRGAGFQERLEVGFRLDQSVLHPGRGLLAYRSHSGQLRCYSFPLRTHLWSAAP